MVEVNNTNDDTPSIRSILTDNSDYLSDIVKTLNTNIAPSIEKISKTIITIDKRDQKSQENA